MNTESKNISNSFSTGGGGDGFEKHVEAAFAVLMLAQGFSPCFTHNWPIHKIKLQGKYDGYETDDFIVFTKEPTTNREAKLLAQVKHKVTITDGNGVFGEVIKAAWQDFNNKKIFTENVDAIALITGPLSPTDIQVRFILERARAVNSSEEFYKQINTANYVSDTQREKLEVFRHHLKKANNNIDISPDELWRFLRNYHLLGYDLDIRRGVTLSLLHTMIGIYSPSDVHLIWGGIVEDVLNASPFSGILTTDSFSDDVTKRFKKREVKTIPDEIVTAPPIPIVIPSVPTSDTYLTLYSTELAIASLIGSWNENYEQDKTVVGIIANETYHTWISKIRAIHQQPDSPFIFKDGKWEIKKRLEILQAVKQTVYDEHLNRFYLKVVNVLSENDPQFELPVEDRYMAGMSGKVMKNSPAIRKGLSEGLALLGNQQNTFVNCSGNTPETIAARSVRELLNNADWVRWASLNDILPILAEASPVQFLTAVDDAIQKEPCPFIELFPQERSLITSHNYLAGILWGLESLAWEEQYLTQVTVILGELAALDPGSNFGNRPINSLTTIFLPWMPQTLATIEKRKIAMRNLIVEVPDMAWKTLLSLLPNAHQTTMGSNKPIWRKTIPDGWSSNVTKSEYWDQVSNYSNMAVESAKNDFNKLLELIERLDNLPEPSINELLSYISSDKIKSMPESERTVLWNKLSDLVAKHKKYADAKWALKPELVERINNIAGGLVPKSPMKLYQRLFSGRDIDLYE